jgi:DNA-binding LacI/PurR family transcriptional regulator
MRRTVTLRDLAVELGVSIATISKALKNHPDISDSRREQVLELVQKKDYIPNQAAKSLRSNVTKFIGLIITDNSNPYFSKLIRGVEEENATQGFHTLIFNNDEDVDKELEIINECRSINVAGVVLTPAMGNSLGINMLKRYDIPYVLSNRCIARNRDNYVIADDVKAGYLAADYLVKKRHRKLLFINYFPKLSSARERQEGYLKALADNGLKTHSSHIYRDAVNQEDGYRIAKEILRKHKPPLSILCYSDYIATGVLKALLEQNIDIPQEVAVMGIDDIDLFSFSKPALSTVNIPKSRIGRKSVGLLLQLVNHEDGIDHRIVFDPFLVARESA